jgi:hypothetical protein
MRPEGLDGKRRIATVSQRPDRNAAGDDWRDSSRLASKRKVKDLELLLARVSLELDECTKLVCTESAVQHDFSLAPVRRVLDVIPVDPAISLSKYLSCCLVVHAFYLSVVG